MINALPQNLRSILASSKIASRLAEISDRFSLSERDRRLQSKILAKLFLKEIKLTDLPRLFQLNLNLSRKEAQILSQVIEKEILVNFKEPKRKQVPRKPTEGRKPPVPQIDPLKLGAAGLRDWLDHLISDLNLSLSTLQRSRLESSILTYLKEVRDEFETEDVLTRGEEKGGVGLGVKEGGEIVYRLKETFPEEKKATFRKYQRNLKPSLISLKPQARELKPHLLTPPPQLVLKKEEKGEEKRNSHLVADVIKPPPPPREEKEEIPQGIDITAFSNLSELGKIRREDFANRNPNLLVRALIAKVNHLIGKNELKRFKAGEAWRDSPIYKLYIGIGQESITKNQTVNEIAKLRMAQDKPYLTEEEFNAIADISREFQY